MRCAVVALVLLALVLWGAPLASANTPYSLEPFAEQPPYPTACPIACGEAAQAWCERVFGRGGNVTVGSCGVDSSFICVCNHAASINITVTAAEGTAQCSWAGEAFDELPGDDMCGPLTGLCPSNCTEANNSACLPETVTCSEDTESGHYDFNCVTCSGRVISVSGNNETCSKTYSESILCDPATTCNGHGCCTRPTEGPYPVCTCHNNAVQGYWAQPQCRECQTGYDSNRGCQQQILPPSFQIVLSSIASTWTMLSPNLAVPVLFVIVGLARRLWDSDRSFVLTALRRANLSPVQTARRGHQSLFRSKYIPRRPAKSRCFIQETQRPDGAPAPRGPPAY